MISQQENVIDDILAPTAVGCRPRVGRPSTQSTTTPSTRHIGTCLAKNQELFSGGQDICRKGILKRLEEPEKPKWEELILGPGL